MRQLKLTSLQSANIRCFAPRPTRHAVSPSCKASESENCCPLFDSLGEDPFRAVADLHRSASEGGPRESDRFGGCELQRLLWKRGTSMRRFVVDHLSRDSLAMLGSGGAAPRSEIQ